VFSVILRKLSQHKRVKIHKGQRACRQSGLCASSSAWNVLSCCCGLQSTLQQHTSIKWAITAAAVSQQCATHCRVQVSLCTC
jgi:hypothetical protein